MSVGSFYPGAAGYTKAFQVAEEFLAAGKNKSDRPVKANTRLRRVDADTIALVLHSTAVVTYHRDGTFTIYGGGWNTVTTKGRISEFSPVRPGSDGNGSWIIGYTGEKTAPKLRKCRTCKGRGRWMEDDLCYPRYDYSTHPCVKVPCSHGMTELHVKGQSERSCYRCSGSGTADYGSKPIPVLTTASSVFRVSASGELLEDDIMAIPNTGHHVYSKSHYYPPAPADPYAMGSSVADKVATVVPAMDELVRHPENGVELKLRDAIVSLNDQFRWSRERIADWLDTLDLDLSFPVS